MISVDQVKKVIYIYVTLLSFLSFTSRGQEVKNDNRTSSQTVVNLLARTMLFNKHYPQEKVYLHFDNTGYFKGERIWYKAYVVRADNGMATDISRVLYVELVTPGGDVVETQKLPIGKDGTARGDILLDRILGTGFYEVRAYTRYMTNWGEGGIFSRVFPVFEKPEKEGDYTLRRMEKIGYKNRLPSRMTEMEPQMKKMNVRFYPEGGRLVENLKSRVAFTVTGDKGQRICAEGRVQGKDGSTVCQVKAVNGRGIFSLIPSREDMTLVLYDAKGKEHRFPLPDAEPQGCSLYIDAVSGEKVTAVMQSSASMHGKLLGYAVMHNGNIVICDTMTAKASMAKEIDRGNLPEGVVQFTVFDSCGRILADRLFFVHHALPVADGKIRIETEEDRLLPCGKVRLTLKSEEDASISFSAMDMASMPCGKSGNIKTWMLLASDIKGYIENPEYYFEADDEIHRRAADTLMLIQGWRRYDWQLMSGEKTFGEKIQPVEDKLYIFGKVKGRSRQADSANIKIEAFLYNDKGESLTGSCQTEADGAYRFELPDISGTWNLIMKATDMKKGRSSDCIITIDRLFSPKKRLFSYDEMQFKQPNTPNIRFSTGTDSDTIGNSETPDSMNIILPTVNITDKSAAGKGPVIWYRESTGAYKASIFYDCDEATEQIADSGMECPPILDWLKGKNEFFAGESVTFWDTTPSDIVVQNEYLNETDPTLSVSKRIKQLKEIRKAKESTSNIVDSAYHIYKDGIVYKGRPVVWIVNNKYSRITGMKINNKKGTEGWSMGRDITAPLKVTRCTGNPNVSDFPDFVDEVKSVYISEDPEQYHEFILFENEPSIAPVTVFLYTHPVQTNRERGQRRTYFQGFNVPTTFQTEDYSFLPPTEDFRRTIYWNPDVRTDKEGKATVEFYNNSNCTRMYVSAEGMTRDGRFVANE